MRTAYGIAVLLAGEVGGEAAVTGDVLECGAQAQNVEGFGAVPVLEGAVAGGCDCGDSR